MRLLCEGDHLPGRCLCGWMASICDCHESIDELCLDERKALR